jgi:hypothetical protein
MNSEPATVLVREGSLDGDGRFDTFPVTPILFALDLEGAAANEYKIRCVQDSCSADGLRTEWLGKDFTFTWPGWTASPYKLIGLDEKQKNFIMKAGDKLRAIPIKKEIVKAMQKQHPVESTLAKAKRAAAAKSHKIDRVA